MSSPLITGTVAAEHVAQLRREAGIARLVALARCCQPGAWRRGARQLARVAGRLRDSLRPDGRPLLPAGMRISGRKEVPPVRIRDAAPADLPAVRRLVGDAGLPLDGLTDAYLVLVADVDHAVVGTVALERHGVDRDTANLRRSAAVDSAKRGLGIGARLTAVALERVDAAGAPVALFTETAEDYFPGMASLGSTAANCRPRWRRRRNYVARARRPLMLCCVGAGEG